MLILPHSRKNYNRWIKKNPDNAIKNWYRGPWNLVVSQSSPFYLI